jgi:hypothetical protein
METCSVIKKETDPGFDLFFSSNLEEMTDVPIYFENPLPTWLHGGKMQTDKKKTM